MLDQLELQSGFARRWLLDAPMMVSGEEITAAYDVLRRFTDFIGQVEKTYIDTLLFKLQGLKDIRTTIKNLRNQAVLASVIALAVTLWLADRQLFDKYGKLK